MYTVYRWETVDGRGRWVWYYASSDLQVACQEARSWYQMYKSDQVMVIEGTELTEDSKVMLSLG